MSPSVLLLGVGLLAWLLLLLRPGWIWRVRRPLRRHRWPLATALVGMAAVWALDPLISRAPEAALEEAARWLTEPGLASRFLALALGTAFVATPLIADARWGGHRLAVLA
ncbi:MAG: hypothetical protein ACRDJN_31455, partial [Chloroflexota bacterium]